MTLELKTLIEDSNRLVEELRAESKSKDVVTEQKLARMESELASQLSAKSALEAKLTALETAQARAAISGKSADVTDEVKSAFVEFLRAPTDYAKKSAYEALSKKGMDVTVPANGAVAVPRVIATEIARVAKDFGAVRSLARVVTVGTSDYKEILSLGGAAGEWVGDTDTRNVTATPTLADVKPTFGEIAARAQATNQALEDVFFDLESFLTLELGETFAQMESAAFISGNGVNKPTGLLNGNTITTTKTGVAANFGANPFDNLIDLVYGVKGSYRANAHFLLNSATLASLVKVKDSTGNYIYQPSVAAGVASTLLGYRIATDENMPSVGAGAKVAVFGDFSRGYLICDRIGMGFLTNPYKTSGLVEFEARKRVGGIVKDAAALKALVVSA